MTKIIKNNSQDFYALRLMKHQKKAHQMQVFKTLENNH